MRRIISLDFDGVLHPSPRHLPRQDVAVFSWLDHLELLLVEHHDVGLLVHSSWRETYPSDEIQDVLHPMEARFVGVAPPGDRAAAIVAWRQSNAPDSLILAIDDDCELQEISGVEILRCDPRLGLSEEAAQRAVAAWLERTRPATA